ncbi:MAG: HvfC/BufC family peptide modification chaperone [Paracoccaceae bacterium]
MTMQERFRAALLDPAAPLPEGLIDAQGRPAARRYDIYRNNIATSLGEALGAGFPTLAALLGEANFKAVASAYLRAHPPRSPLMMHYGADMPDFIAAVPPLAHMGYLPDVARLDLALRDSYHAADHTPLAPQVLGGLDEPALMGARLTLAPSLRVLASAFPLHAIWQRATGGAGEIPEAAQGILITRVDYTPVLDALSEAEAHFAAALAENTPLGAAYKAANGIDPGFDPARVLSILVQNGAIYTLKEAP